ncbi:MAG: transglycosylase domain-containing protein [Anaerolineae bacterium]|nr:transglycosylase domain-containing protein [Anaerolineae bacterium]
MAHNGKKRRGCFGCAGTVILLGLFMVIVVGLIGAAAAVTVVSSNLSAELEDGISRLANARDRETFATTEIYDRNGNVLWEIFGEGKRTQVSLSSIPLHMQQATIALEDDTFYENRGFDEPSLVAAVIANLRNPDGRPVGGSTITQQLVRHIAFDYEERTSVSYNRKLKELILAWRMTQDFSKDEILEMYLNEIYYGNLAYGVEAAARTYFDKTSAELTLAEAALLAALPNSPVELDPYTNLEGAKERQWVALVRMVEDGFITMDDANAAYLQELTFEPQEVSLVAPHFSIYVRQLLEEQLGADVVANGGLRITTSLDLDYQRLAEELARRHVSDLADNNVNNASLVALKPGTGEVLAMLGSVDYHNDSIDGRVNVALSPQQPGSTMKPLTYAAALSPDTETGVAAWDPASLVWDVPVDYDLVDGSVYQPVNYDDRFHGPLRLRDALANSYNIPALLVLQDIGVPRLLEFTRSVGIESLGDNAANYGLSLTLGGGEVTPLELTGAYATFANGGVHVPPVAVLKVERANGDVLYEYEPPQAEPVVDPRVAFIISDILADDAARVPAMGRNNVLDLPFPAAAKTGTTNDFRDNWTMGYTPGLTVGVWTGNTDNSPMIDVSGLSGAAPLWSEYMQAVYADPALRETLQTNGVQPPDDFVPPPGVERQTICTIESVTVGSAECALTDSEWKLVDTDVPAPTPTEVSEAPLVVWESVDPSVVRAPALPLPPPSPESIANSAEDEDAIPPQLFCTIAAGADATTLPPQAVPTLFLEAPRNSESLKAAYEWAFARGLSILPAANCTEDALVRDPNAPAVWRISSPRPGDTLTGPTSIDGIADFDPQRVQFYKLEIKGAGTDNQWVTFGNTHDTPVANGRLEFLNADGLPPGDYEIRLIVVQWDGNYVGEPYTIPVTIER